jgi:hypothetical protein
MRGIDAIFTAANSACPVKYLIFLPLLAATSCGVAAENAATRQSKDPDVFSGHFLEDQGGIVAEISSSRHQSDGQVYSEFARPAGPGGHERDGVVYDVIGAVVRVDCRAQRWEIVAHRYYRSDDARRIEVPGIGIVNSSEDFGWDKIRFLCEPAAEREDTFFSVEEFVQAAGVPQRAEEGRVVLE